MTKERFFLDVFPAGIHSSVFRLLIKKDNATINEIIKALRDAGFEVDGNE